MPIRNSFDRWFARAKGFFARQRPSSGASAQELQAEELLRHLLMAAEQTQEVEYSCDEVFALLDQYTEMAARGEDVALLMPLVERHLDMCPECREEYEALRRILEASPVS